MVRSSRKKGGRNIRRGKSLRRRGGGGRQDEIEGRMLRDLQRRLDETAPASAWASQGARVMRTTRWTDADERHRVATIARAKENERIKKEKRKKERRKEKERLIREERSLDEALEQAALQQEAVDDEVQRRLLEEVEKDEEFSGFNFGDKVTVTGLQSATQHNGKTGVVVSSLNTKKRYTVVLDELSSSGPGQSLDIKPANMIKLDASGKSIQILDNLLNDFLGKWTELSLSVGDNFRKMIRELKEKDDHK
jgi:hypothetical protein